MLKVLDLFSGTQSVRKALDKMDIEYEYYGIDIYSPEEENIILDLSQDDIVNKLIENLPKGWVPDFIWASPVCSCFSISAACGGGNLYFEKTLDGVKVREDYEPVKRTQQKNYGLKKIQDTANLHLKLVSNMLEIIKHFGVNFAIENPATSYIKYYIPKNIYRNYADYCRYGMPYKKPTCIYSNNSFDFKRCNHKKHETIVGGSTKEERIKLGFKDTYADRARVPSELIKEIIKQTLNGGERSLFNL